LFGQQSEPFDEDDLYEAMDGLNGRWVPIEKKLYATALPQGVSLVIYDLTSVYFEGKGPQGLAPIFHKPIQIAGSIFINWQIISHFRQVHGVVGL
jgi:hypothetical protein